MLWKKIGHLNKGHSCAKFVFRLTHLCSSKTSAVETRAAGMSLQQLHWGPGSLRSSFSRPVHFLAPQVRIPINFRVWRSLGSRGEARGKRWLRRHVFIKSNEAVVRSLHLGLMGIPPEGSLNKQCGGKNTADPVDREAEQELCRSRTWTRVVCPEELWAHFHKYLSLHTTNPQVTKGSGHVGFYFYLFWCWGSKPCPYPWEAAASPPRPCRQS